MLGSFAREKGDSLKKSLARYRDDVILNILFWKILSRIELSSGRTTDG